jgi:anion-transporting  ArsA/GET3 family ATPase
VPGFDLIIVDAPATGHGLSLLRVPETLLNMIQVGPIANQTRTVLETLQDPSKTGIVQVTLAEELPVKEALEFETSARDELKMAHDMIFINTIFPDIFDPEEQTTIQALASRPKNEWPVEVSTMLDFAKWEIGRRTLQQRYIDKLIRTTDASLVGIPYYFTSDLGLVEIGEIADMLMGLMEMSHEQEVDYA